MKADKLRSYRFAAADQWNACLLAQADQGALRKHGVIRPIAPFSQTPVAHPSKGAHAPAMMPTGEILWRDDEGLVYRLSPGDDEAADYPAPLAIRLATRIISAPAGLWVMGKAPEPLQLYEDDSLTRLLAAEPLAEQLVDIAYGGQDTLFALVERQKAWRAVRLDCSGRVIEEIDLKDISDATAFVYLRRSRRFVVLAGESHPRLYWFSEKGKALFSLAVAGMHPCFAADVLASGDNDRLLLAGRDGEAFDSRAFVLILDGEGQLLDELPLDRDDAPTTGLAATGLAAMGLAAKGDRLVVAGHEGILLFQAAETVPEDARPAKATVLTRMLVSPDREDGRRWLRIEATAKLSEGSSLEIAWAATDEEAAAAKYDALAADESKPVSQRLANLLTAPDLRRGTTVFHGAAGADSAAKTFSAKLFDVTERSLSISVTLTANGGARLPQLSRLVVYYPGRTLMEDLPPIYQREEARPDSFLRALVGVLETTTQGLDAQIGSLGRLIDPESAPEKWLDYLARWLGIPWDDALSLGQKRSLITRAEELASGRGTRAGLEALLECLVPGSPPRFRVTDAAADHGFAVLGGEACPGFSLPAILGGWPRRTAELDIGAVLGRMRLPAPGQANDGSARIAATVRVDVAATAAEKTAWSPWLSAMIAEMVPIGARATLRWVAPRSLSSPRLDGTLILEPLPTPHLGVDAITGQTRLPASGMRLSAAGPIVGGRLR